MFHCETSSTICSIQKREDILVHWSEANVWHAQRNLDCLYLEPLLYERMGEKNSGEEVYMQSGESELREM